MKKSALNPLSVAICVTPPKWAPNLRIYSKLAPPEYLLFQYRNGYITDDQYTDVYCTEVLDKLNAQEVYNELGDDAILLCWESPDKYCHRHIVAKWLESELGIIIKELE
jgi:hypothetical protein